MMFLSHLSWESVPEPFIRSPAGIGPAPEEKQLLAHNRAKGHFGSAKGLLPPCQRVMRETGKGAWASSYALLQADRISPAKVLFTQRTA